jgi:hypothetical protein
MEKDEEHFTSLVDKNLSTSSKEESRNHHHGQAVGTTSAALSHRPQSQSPPVHHQQRAMTPPIHSHGHAIPSHTTPTHSHGATLAVLPITRGLHHQQHNNNHDTSTDRPRSGSTSNMPALTGTGVDSSRTRGHSQSVDVPSNPSHHHHNSDFSQVRTSGNFTPVTNTSNNNNGTNGRSTSASRPQRSTNSVHSEQNSARSELADGNLQIHGNCNSHSSKQNSSTPQKQSSLHHKIALLKEQETENFQPISRKSSKQAWNENGKRVCFVFSFVYLRIFSLSFLSSFRSRLQFHQAFPPQHQSECQQQSEQHSL